MQQILSVQSGILTDDLQRENPSEDDPPFNSLRLSASAVKTCFIITL
jgi:hypothetical protein